MSVVFIYLENPSDFRFSNFPDILSKILFKQSDSIVNPRVSDFRF